MRVAAGSVVRLLVVVCLATTVWAQGSRQISPYDSIAEHDQDNPKAREQWFARGRTVPGESSAQLRYRAFQQKMQLRRQRALLQAGAAAGASTTTPWIPLGPAPLASDAGTLQDYNWVSGRATAVAIDPADATGNTVFVGGAHGGVWKSTNAGPASTSAGSVIWTPVTDFTATLAVGAIAIQPGNNNPASSVVLVGTGEPNSSADSYYGLGILRSTDGGTSWTLITASSDVSSRSFAGLGFSKIAFSSSNPQLVVAAAAGASQGIQEGLEDPVTVNRGIYVSSDGGQTWKYASIKDGATTTSPGSVTSVVYNAAAGAFFAAVRYHGIYKSTDGMNWTRLADANQPGTVTLAQCPTNPSPVSSSGCPFYRAELSVVPGRNEMYTWVVYLNSAGNEADGGIWQTRNGGSAAWTAINHAGITTCGDNQGCGVTQGTYNLEVLALPNVTRTDLYTGTINLYKCTITNPASPSCTFLNLTHVYGTCASTERVHPDQHHLAGVIASGKELLYFANDGGIYRALDGYTGLTGGSCQPNQFDSLNQTLGSMTQFVSFSMHPTDPATLLGGTQDNGSPATSAATGIQWKNVHAGDGGYNAILPTSPMDWFASYPDTGGFSLRIEHCASGINCTDPTFAPVVTSFNLGNDDGEFYFPYILDPQSPKTMLVGTCRVWRVQNATSPTAYTALSGDFEPSATTPCTGGEVNLARSLATGGPTDANGFSKVIYVGTDGFGPLISDPTNSTPTGGRIFVTTDASVASPVFTEVTGNTNPNHYPVASVAVDSADPSGKTAYVGIMGFHVSHVFKTMNAGGSWTDFSGGLPDAPVNSLLVDASTGVIYAGTDVGVFASSTSGASWSEVGPSAAPGNSGFLPNVPVTALGRFESGGKKLLRASTYGRGVWEYNLATTPDYAIVVQNNPLTVFASQTGAISGTLTALAGYSSGVGLSCTAGPTNPPATCAAQTSPVTPTTAGAPFQINVGGTAGDYTFNVHAAGSDSSNISHDVMVTVQVVDFALGAPSPSSVSVMQGGTTNAVTLVVSATGSFAGTVSLSCPSGLPANAQCDFSPASVQPTAANPATVALMISAGASTPVGSSTVTIAATTTGAPAAKTRTLGLTVTAPPADYTLIITNPSLSAIVNQPATFQGTLTSLFGYNSPVNLSCGANAPPTCTVSPAAVTPTAGGASFTVTVQSNQVQAYSWAVRGTGTDAATVTHAANVNFSSLFTFSVADASGPQTVQAGQTATYSLAVTPPSGVSFPKAVSFSCTGLPAGATCSAPSIAAGASGVQNVTLTISTLGPSSTTGLRPIARNRGPAPWVFWVAAAGLIFGGFPRRDEGKRKLLTILSLGLLVLLMLALPSCGGSAGSSSGGGRGVTISVSPTSKSLFSTQQQQFTATVAGTTKTAVNWTASAGTVDASGLYTAPAVTSTTQATVTAVALADVTKSAAATVTIQEPTPSGSYVVTVKASDGSITQSTTATLNVQ